jgi:hypothetical protein
MEGEELEEYGDHGSNVNGKGKTKNGKCGEVAG